MPLRILLVDPRPEVRDALELGLDACHHDLIVAEDAATALNRLDRQGADVVVCEATTEGLEGFAFVPQLRRRAAHVELVLLAETNAPKRFQDAEKLGAAALLEVPVRREAVGFAITKASERMHMRRATRMADRDVTDAVGEKPIVGASQPMIELLELMERAAGFKTPVTILGETGSHREVLARAVHAQSMRRNSPFVAVRCRAGSPEDVEQRLFGAPGTTRAASAEADVRLADGGTLFLDDLASLSAACQKRLLHLLEREEVVDSHSGKSEPVDVRIIVATTADYVRAVDAGQLDPQVVDRLTHVLLQVPPLRERAEDIPLIVDQAVARLHAQLGTAARAVSDTAMDRLRHHHWPGNLRELENVIERAMLVASTDELTVRDLPTEITTSVGDAGGSSSDFSLRRARRSFEAEMIRRALRKTDGNRTRAAKLLEISHRALLYKIKEFGLRDS